MIESPLDEVDGDCWWVEEAENKDESSDDDDFGEFNQASNN